MKVPVTGGARNVRSPESGRKNIAFLLRNATLVSKNPRDSAMWES
jgi:hypothetical protein